jgi:uncharacterized protein YktA (UPF0223 family)
MTSYDIDYHQFNTEEIIIIVEFLAYIETLNPKKVDKESFNSRYSHFRNTIQSKSMQTEIEKKFEKQTGISIFKLYKSINK